MVLIAWLMAVAGQSLASTGTLTLRGLTTAGEPILEVSKENFDVECREAEKGWIPDLISAADAARRRVGEVTRDSLLVRVRMIIAPTQAIFLQLAGAGAENSVAVSVGGHQTVIINLQQLRTQGLEKFGALLVHELSHVYIDVRCKSPVPRWLHEGLAQSIAGDISGSAAGLLTANTLGQLIPLAEMEHGFPGGLERELLAYRESYSVVQFIIAQRHGGSLPALLQSISGDEGVANLELLWSPVYRDALQIQWKKSLGNWRDWIAAVAGSGSFWVVVAALTVLAWVVRKHRSRDLRREWDEEEKVYAVLDEEEKKLYGDEDPDHDPYAVEGEYVDPEYEDVYEDGVYKGTRKVE